jgi:hypothetical protein
MKSIVSTIVGTMVFAAGTAALSQQQTAPARGSDIYHVHFAKAAPGQAGALAKALMEPDPTAAMPTHFVVLRHQEGDDWDYAVIQHVGKAATVAPAPAGPNPARDLYAWHTDTFVTGPSWADFTRAMGIGGSGTANAVYTVGVHRPAAGHRDQLEQALSQPPDPASKIQTGSVIMQHVEGSEWTFLTITRYNAWQDLAAERAQATAAGGTGWTDIRQHSAFHRDTIADRLFPAK